MIQIQESDIFGEDRLLYDRANQYSVKVISKFATLYQINIKEFIKSFPKVIKPLRITMDIRFNLITQRLESIKTISEYTSLKFQNSNIN